MLSIHALRVNLHRDEMVCSNDGEILRSQELKLNVTFLRKSFMMLLLLGLSCIPLGAEETRGRSSNEQRSSRDNVTWVSQITPPDGFSREPVDEPGILRWRKDSGEIYLVEGDLFVDSGDMLFKAIRKALEKDDTVKEVKNLRLKGGKAMLYKKKAPSDSGRLRSWRLLAITDNKIINVDFAAPSRDFDKLIPAFEEALKSFKLTPK